MNLTLLCWTLLALQAPESAEKPVAIKGVRILTASGDEIPVGTVVIKDGKIEAVGAEAAVPAGAQVIDGSGRVLMPGLIHPATRIGSSLSGSGNAPDHVAIEELAPSLDAYRPIVRAGFTTPRARRFRARRSPSSRVASRETRCRSSPRRTCAWSWRRARG